MRVGLTNSINLSAKTGNSINCNKKSCESTNFKGIKKYNNDRGMAEYLFYLPNIPEDKNVELELVSLNKDKSGVWVRNEKIKPLYLPLNKDGECTVNPKSPKHAPVMVSGTFGYRFNIKNSDGEKINSFMDAGVYTNCLAVQKYTEKYNIVPIDRPIIAKNGAGQLIMTDIYEKAEFEQNRIEVDSKFRETSEKTVRNHANLYGGNLAGIAAHAKTLSEIEGVTRIVGMPFTKDDISSHKYWTQNPYQVSTEFGTLNDFKKMQVEFFKNDINYLFDAALVNQGLTGVQFSHILNWGKKSPFYNWFNVSALNDKKLGLGILPDKLDNIEMKIVNHPKSKNYKRSKPTYLQVYDNRLVTDKQKKDFDNLIVSYDKKNTESTYEISSFYDTVPPYYFEISPTMLTAFLNSHNMPSDKNKFTSADGGKSSSQSILVDLANHISPNWILTSQTKPTGMYLWDGNIDIPKLKFTVTAADNDKAIKSDINTAMYNVQDFAINAVGYWAKVTKDAQLEYAAKQFKDFTKEDAANIENIVKKAIDDGKLPKSLYNVSADGEKTLKISKEKFNNVITGRYKDIAIKPREDISVAIPKLLMEQKFETFECNNNLAAVLSSPYISKKANNEDELLGKNSSRYEVSESIYPTVPQEYKATYNETNAIFKNQFTNFASRVLTDVFDDDDVLYDTKSGKLTIYGQYVLPLIMPEIFKYGLTKALYKQDVIVKSDEDGAIEFYESVWDNGAAIERKVNPKDITLLSAEDKKDKAFNHPREEAQHVIKKLENHLIYNSTEDNDVAFVEALKKRLDGLNAVSFMMADMLIDESNSGLGMRVDASKDIADYDAVRSKFLNADSAWNSTVRFWSKVNDKLTSINPHAVTYAEITDLEQFNPYFEHKTSSQAVTNFILDTNVTSEADYTFFFSGVGNLLGGAAEEGSGGNYYDIGQLNNLYGKLVEGWEGNPGKIFNMPVEGVTNSYTFVGNHDKPRLFHTLSLNMELFFSDFNNEEHKQKASNALKIDQNKIDYRNVSSKAIAVADRYLNVFDTSLNTAESLNRLTSDEKVKFNNSIKEAVAFFASGQVNPKNKENILGQMLSESSEVVDSKMKAIAFGVRPFNKTLEQVINYAKNNLNDKTITEKIDTEKFRDEMLGKLLTPSLDKYKSMYKILVALPGAPTDFCGDRLGVSGFESHCKNLYQQNRSHIPFEKLKGSTENIYKDIYNNTNAISRLRKAPELSALNDGMPVVLPKIETEKKDFVLPILRYNDKGSTVITLMTNDGMTTNGNVDKFVQSPLERRGVEIDSLLITPKKADADSPKVGLATGLPNGMKFKKYDDGKPTDGISVVENKNGVSELKYYKDENCSYPNLPIKIAPEDNNVLILYAIK